MSDRTIDSTLNDLAAQFDSVEVRPLALDRVRARCWDDTPTGRELVATYIIDSDGTPRGL